MTPAPKQDGHRDRNGVRPWHTDGRLRLDAEDGAPWPVPTLGRLLELARNPEQGRLARDLVRRKEAFGPLVVVLTDRRGHPRMVRVCGDPHHDDDGRFRGYRGSTVDVSEYVLAADDQNDRIEWLESVQQHLAVAIESVSDFAYFDADDRLVLFNSHFRDSLGDISRLVVPGTPFAEIVKALSQLGFYGCAADAEKLIRRRMDLHRRHASHEQMTDDGRWFLVKEYPTHDGGFVLTRTDITEFKRIEAKLSESEANLRAVLNATDDAIYLAEPDGRIVAVNREGARRFGLSAAEMVGRRYPTLVGRGKGAGRDHPARLAVAAAQPARRRTHVRGRWFEDVVYPIAGPSGQVIRLALFSSDITHRKAVDDAFAESEANLRAVFDATTDGVMLIDRRGVILDINQAGAGLYGLTVQEIAGARIDRLVGLGFDKGHMRLIRSVFATGEALRFEDGRDDTWFEHHFFPVKDKTGKAVRLAIYSRDISERRRTGDALAQTQANLRAAIDAIGDMMFLIDIEGTIIAANEPAAREFSLGVAEVIGRDILSLMKPEIGLHRRAMGENAIKTGRAVSFEDSFRDRWFEHRMFPVKGEDGAIVGLAVYARDITERKRVEDELRKARDAAETANRAKTRFLASASHDLRQPLQALNNFVEILSFQTIDGEVRRTVSRIEQSLEALNGMLSILFDISKLEAGLLEPEPADFSVGHMLSRLRGTFWPEAQAKGLTLKIVPCAAVINSDPTLLERIVGNLLSNAVRHTARGKILCGCRRTAGGVRIEVWDTGPGIPENEIGNVFKEFHQIGNEARNRRQGLGLGLAIVERLSKLLDHKVTVRSTPGRGSVFAVEVPMARLELRRPRRRRWSTGDEVEDALVLIVDDDPDIAESLAQSFGNWGYRTLLGGRVSQVLDLLSGLGSRPDLVVADYRLGDGVTGIHLIEAVRNLVGTPVPGILITGDTAPEPARDAKALGLELLHKPITLRELRRIAAGILSERQGGRRSKPEAS